MIFDLSRVPCAAAAVAVTAALTAALGGCASTSDDLGADQQPSQSAAPIVAETSSPAVTSATAASTTRSTSTSTPVPEPKVPQARELLLWTDQLPGTGWNPVSDADPESAERQEASQPECSNQSWMLRTAALRDEAAAGWSFDAAAEVEAITSQVFVYSDERAAETALAAYREVTGRCMSWQMGTNRSGYAFQHDQGLFDAPIATESVARTETTSMISYPDVPAAALHWVSARSGSTIVQVTYRPGSLLGSTEGQQRTIELATVAVNNTRNQP